MPRRTAAKTLGGAWRHVYVEKWSICARSRAGVTAGPRARAANQVELFREELKLDNAQERVQAMRRVADVARQIGPQATREALLPMLQGGWLVPAWTGRGWVQGLRGRTRPPQLRVPPQTAAFALTAALRGRS